ncbi:S8 family peptidase [Myroides sp. NP-2]|uniref:S8 family peptidase n=1 Tax=Myroides sp. NP-2 TaxID=2759945 RepID=UPI0015FDFD1C|nr:S8 family peptidase [Myroides sp. NP-2]MBB1150914.1 S8 family peptidase [Myroides sp. NP-2]
MFRIKSFLLCSFLFTATTMLGQSNAIRQQLSQQYTTTEAISQINALTQKEGMLHKELLKFKKNNRSLKTEFVDGTNYYQAQRLEQNKVIYFKTNNEVSRKVSGVEQLISSDNPVFNQLLGQQMLVGIIDGDLVFNRHIEFEKSGSSKVQLRESWDTAIPEDPKEFAVLERRRSHATHVAGTIVAQGLDVKAKGIAPEAEAISYRWSNDMTKLAQLAQQGVLISNHSYGIAAVDNEKKPLLSPEFFGAYTIDAVHMDKIAYLYPYVQPVVAAGNDKIYADLVNPTKQGMDLLLGHANAKNAIVVAAVGVDDTGKLVETNFSSPGPTNDFRIKPDIAAIGENVYSSIYQYHNPNGQIEKTNLYASLSGTSMATPSVSGILLLWQQWALTHKQFPYKAATLKGLVVASAEYLPNQTGPNARIGWGLINAWNGVQLLEAAENEKAFIREDHLTNGQSHTFKVQLTEEVNRLSFTICWTDVEGPYSKLNFVEGNTSKYLVNDLDIRVYRNGETFFPWRLTNSFVHAEAVKGDNSVDNLERIDLDFPEKGTYEVVVSHKNKLVHSVQDYSLLIHSDTYSGVRVEHTLVDKNIQEMVAWPIPTTDVLHLEIPAPFVFTSLEATIHNSNGRLIQTIPIIASHRQNVSVSSLAAGMYFLQVRGGNEKYQIKFIKK